VNRAAARAIVCLAAAVTGACSTAVYAPQQILSGRLAVQVAASASEPARQLGGSFDLRGDATRGQLDLVSPIGVTVARAQWQPGRAELATNDAPLVFANLDELANRAFGEALPLAALFDWLRGRPWAGATSMANADGTGFEQLGWQVQTDGLAEGRITARRAAPPEVTLRARLDPAPQHNAMPGS
jgi:outer membrane lipoprotein LolB